MVEMSFSNTFRSMKPSLGQVLEFDRIGVESRGLKAIEQLEVMVYELSEDKAPNYIF